MSTPSDPLSRRRFLKSVGAVGVGLALGGCDDDTAGASTADATTGPAPDAGPPARAKLAIVGGGAAGVFAAWLLDGAYDVTVFEAGPKIGGNVRTISIPLNSHRVTLDMGAQFFHPGPYPTYTRLLEHLGVHVPDEPDASDSYRSPSSITVHHAGEELPRFVSPIAGERNWPVGAEWNAEGLGAFNLVTQRAEALEASGDWSLTAEAWLREIELSDAQREEIILPWLASLFSGVRGQAGGLSARAAMTFLSRTVAHSGIADVSYYILRSGMGAVLEGLIEASTTVEVQTRTEVEAITRDEAGFHVQVGGAEAGVFDELLMATPGHVTAALLEGLPEAEPLRAALGGIEWHDARLVLHGDPAYAHPDSDYRSFLNVLVDGDSSEASMSMAAVLPLLPNNMPAALWKSWATGRSREPAGVIYEVDYRHMLPTPASISAQARLAEAQGAGGVHVIGGYTQAYDAQETALLTAMAVATTLTEGRALPEAANLIAFSA